MSKQTRCPHYQLYAQNLGLDHGPNVLTVRRCLLTERLIRLLDQTPDGALLTPKLTVRMDSAKEYAFVGPDLEAVTHAACRVMRCEAQCTPAYMEHLRQFNVTDPALHEVTCGEPSGDGEPVVPEALSARAVSE